MWHREDLKERARLALKSNGYWVALAVLVVFAVLAGGLTAGAGGISRGLNTEYRTDIADSYHYLGPGQWITVAEFLAFSLAVLACGCGIFVALPLQVGKSRFFLEHRKHTSTVGALFHPFRPGYLNVVKTMFATQFIVFLWTLLLIVPGIIKAFQYILVPYILAENPDIEWRRALALSREMTDGCKFDIFVLQLSFLGWFLLGLIALVIGMLFVGPYYEGTMAELYATLRLKVLESGFASESELPGVH